MKQRYSIIALLVGLIAGASLINSIRGQQAKNMVSSADNQFVLLDDALNEIGTTYGYYFTLEEALQDGMIANRIASQRIQRLTRGSDAKQELDELVRLIPDLTYVIDEENPKIVHLIDGKLTQTKGYAVDDRIKEINFSGTVYELVDAITKQGIRISSKGEINLSELPLTDFTTQVVAKGEGISVRSALSDFIPLEGRSNRLLWVAKTKPGREETGYIRFLRTSEPKKP
jgi:hypothetical protein